jgi:hypothetical protein
MDKARVLISENAMARSAAARLTPEERRTAEELSRRSVEALIAANGGTSEAADAAFAQSYSSLAYESRRKRSEAFIAVHFDRHIKPRVTVTDAEIQAAFERDSAVFNTPAAADFSTVTLHVARDLQVNPAAATAEDWARAERVTLGRAEDVRKQIAAGASFAPLAERYSQDPKALAGGRWRHLSRHSFVREDFEDKVFSLTPDAPPEVVVSRTQDPSQTWVVVVQLHALTPAKMVSLAEARPQLEAKLREHRTGELLSRFYGEALEENASLGKRSTEDLKTYFQTAILPKLRAAQAQLEGKPKGTRAVSATTPPS